MSRLRCLFYTHAVKHPATRERTTSPLTSGCQEVEAHSSTVGIGIFSARFVSFTHFRRLEWLEDIETFCSSSTMAEQNSNVRYQEVCPRFWRAKKAANSISCSLLSQLTFVCVNMSVKGNRYGIWLLVSLKGWCQREYPPLIAFSMLIVFR